MIAKWSNSMLYTAQQCGERFRRKYIEREFHPSGPRAKRGIAVHKVAGESHVRQLRGKEAGQPRSEYSALVPSDEEARDMAATAFDAAVAEGVSLTDDERAVGKERVLAAEKDSAVGMSSHYVGRIAQQVDPLAVERSLIIKPEGFAVEIHGIIDLVGEEDLAPLEDAPRLVKTGAKIEVVHDLKTSDKRPREDAIDSNQQLTLYALLRTAQTGKPPDRVRMTTIVRSKQGLIHVTQTGTRSNADLEAVASRLEASIRAVEAGAFVPANPDSWWCSQKYCEFWNDCRFALGKGR